MQADTGAPSVFLGGTVLTGSPAAPRARAVAVAGGRVVAVDEDALGLVDDMVDGGGTVVDLEGGVLMAGFGDGHVHPLWGGVELSGPQVRDAASVAEVAEIVRRFAAAHPEQEWVVGGPYEPTLAPEALFDAAWLDAVVPDRPVLLESSDHHCAWVNSEALRRAGIDAATPDPPAAEIVRRPDGSALGTLVEWTAVDLVRRHAPRAGAHDKREALRRSTAMLAAAGITWVQEASLHPDDVACYVAAAESGELSVRADIALRAEPGEWPRQRAEFAAAREAAAASPASSQVSARTVKLFADGVVEVRTAALLAPYDDAPHTRGAPVWDPAELAEAAAAFDADGFRLHIHAIGDAAVRAALDAVEHAAARNGPRDRRPVIAHVQVVDPADLPRFAGLGVIANFEPLWAQADPAQTELTVPRLGRARSALQYPIGALAATGAVLSFGSDWPVSSYRPLDGLPVAVTRRTPSGDPPGGWLPEQRIPAATAISAYTWGTAYQAFEEHRRGSIEVGRRADLVWLSADPLARPPEHWPAVDVRGTWLGGRRTTAPSRQVTSG